MAHRDEFLRFLAAGAANTVATLLLFEALRRVFPYLAAYSIAYLTGIGLSYWMNARYVFRRRTTWSSAVRFPLVYVVQYLLGALLLWLLVDLAKVQPTLALLIVVAATIPVTFLLSRRVVRAAPAHEPAGTDPQVTRTRTRVE